MSQGELIKTARIKKGWTQEDLAQKINSTSKTIQRIEAGRVKPRPFTLQSLATVLEIPFDQLAFQEQTDAKEENFPTFPRILIHLTALTPLVLPTYLVWLWQKPKYPGFKEEVLQVINFQLNVLAVMIPCGLFAVLFFPVLILMAMGIFTWVMVGINVVRILMGEFPQYPVGIEVFRYRFES